VAAVLRALTEDTIDERVVIETDHERSHPLGTILNEALIEQLLERDDARTPSRCLEGILPAMALRIIVRQPEATLVRTPDPVPLGDLAAIAIRSFTERGMLAVVRPSCWPTFVLPMPWVNEPDIDDVVVLCRQIDEGQMRDWVMDWASRFQTAAKRRLASTGLKVQLRLGEGMIVDPPHAVGALLPASSWRAT
jgi:hypothetical protein